MVGRSKSLYTIVNEARAQMHRDYTCFFIMAFIQSLITHSHNAVVCAVLLSAQRETFLKYNENILIQPSRTV